MATKPRKLTSKLARFYRPKQGEWFKVKQTGMVVKCCACGFKHRIDLLPVEIAGKVEVLLRAFRCGEKE